MNDREYQRLKAAAERECSEKIDAAKAELKSRIEAFTWQLRQSGKKPGELAGKSGKGKVIEAVRAALPGMPSGFTAETVIRCIAATTGESPKAVSVSSALGRLEELKQVERIQKGAGKRPSTYRLVEVNGLNQPTTTP